MSKPNEMKTFIIWSHHLELYSSLQRHLIDSGWQIKHLTSINLLETYADSTDGKVSCLCILNSNDNQFSAEELARINEFHENGNSLIVASTCDESGSIRTNISELTSKFGIKFNSDCVIRPNPYEQYHPSEARLSDFIVNKGLYDSLEKFLRHRDGNKLELTSALRESNKNVDNHDESTILQIKGPHILYVQGCTLNVNRLSTIMMTSSGWALPSKQAICAFYRHEKRGRLIAIGSSSMFSDLYIDKEDNRALLSVLLDFIIDKRFPINMSDSKTIEIPQVVSTPDIDHLLNIPISCLQESEPLPSPQEIVNLIDKRLFSIDNSLLPTIIRAYEQLNVDRKPLTLIKPSFRVRPIRLELATHGFLIRRR